MKSKFQAGHYYKVTLDNNTVMIGECSGINDKQVFLTYDYYGPGYFGGCKTLCPHFSRITKVVELIPNDE